MRMGSVVWILYLHLLTPSLDCLINTEEFPLIMCCGWVSIAMSYFVSNIQFMCPAYMDLFFFTCPASFFIFSLGQCSLDLKALLVSVSCWEADQNCHLTFGFWKWLLASPKQLSWCAFYPGKLFFVCQGLEFFQFRQQTMWSALCLILWFSLFFTQFFY
jgi:hypothetical protein